MARINSKIDGTDVLGVVSAGETLYMARATHTHFGTVKPSIKDFVFDKDSAELLVRLGIGLKHTEDGIALAIYDGNYVTDVESTGDGLLIKYTDIDDGTTSEKTIPWTDLSEAQFEALKDYVTNHELVELDFPNGEFTSVQYDTEDGIALTGTAKTKYKDGSEGEATIAFDIPLVPADDTVTMDRAEEAETKKVLVKATKGLKAIQFTDDGGLEFTLSDGTKLYTAPVGGVGVDIGTGLPASAVEGTLTEAQFNILQASEDNYIMLQHEKYYLNDDGHKEGFATYTHTGYENNTYWIKSITITLNTRAWVLNKGGLAGNGLEFDDNDKLQAKLGTGLSFGNDGSINATATDNPYMNTSEPIDDKISLTSSSTLWNLLVALTSRATKVTRATMNMSSTYGQQLIRLLGLPGTITAGPYNKVYFKQIVTDTNTTPYQLVVHAYFTRSASECYEGILASRTTSIAFWSGWQQVTNNPAHPAPLYVGEYTSGDDAYYSVISFDSHNQDLIFRANYSNKDIKLSELALKSEIPSGGTYYKHELVLTSNSTWEISIYVTTYSTTSIAAQSLSDFYNLFSSRSNLIPATGTGYQNGQYYNKYMIYAICPTAMTSNGIYWANFTFDISQSQVGMGFETLSWAASGVSWTVTDIVTNA